MTAQSTSTKPIKSKYNLISFYENLSQKSSNPISWEAVFEMIKGTKLRPDIEALRKETNSIRQDYLKRTLPAITVSGLFGENRKSESLVAHSGFMQLDFDDVTDISLSIERLKNDPYSFALFISPRGKGLKLIVKVPADSKAHIFHFNGLRAYYQKNFGLLADKQCKDLSRLLFLSWDPELFVNQDSLQWVSSEQLTRFESVLSKLQAREHFVIGKRNDFIFKLASDCKKAGIEIESVLSSINKKFSSEDFTEREIETTIKSAYSRTLDESEKSIASNSGSSILKRAEIYLENKYEIRLNEVSGRIELQEKETNSDFKELNEANIFRELQHANIPLSIPKISALLQSDFVAKYNPFLNYFESLGTWSSQEPDYIEALCSYVPVTDKARFRIQLRKWLVRCIACALETSVFNKQVLVLVGEGQNTGKSTFCRWLCPPTLGEYFTEYVAQDKDGLIALSANFLINLDELATLSKADINSLKSLISKDKINVRLPYAKRSTMQPRRANFISSTNNDEFLVDETGNVRWLCFEVVGQLNFDYKQDINVNDIWRQAYTLYKAGFEYQLTAEELKENEKANSKYLVDSIEVQLIRKYFEVIDNGKGEFMSSSDIWETLAQRHPHVRTSTRNIGKAMKILGFKKVSNYKPDKEYSVHGYYVNTLFF